MEKQRFLPWCYHTSHFSFSCLYPWPLHTHQLLELQVESFLWIMKPYLKSHDFDYFPSEWADSSLFPPCGVAHASFWWKWEWPDSHMISKEALCVSDHPVDTSAWEKLVPSSQGRERYMEEMFLECKVEMLSTVERRGTIERKINV